MAITFLQAFEAEQGGVTAVTVNIASPPAGSNRLAILLSCVGSGGPAAPTGFTVNGSAVTAYNSAGSQTFSFFNISMAYALEAQIAAGNFVANYAGTHDEEYIAVLFYSGVNQTTPFRSANAIFSSGNATSGSANPGSNAADTGVGAVWLGSAQAITNTTGTSRLSNADVDGFEAFHASDRPGATQTLGFSWSGGQDYGVLTGSLVEAAAGGSIKRWIPQLQGGMRSLSGGTS